MLLMLAHDILRWKTCNAANAAIFFFFNDATLQTQIITSKNNEILFKMTVGPLRQGVIRIS